MSATGNTVYRQGDVIIIHDEAAKPGEPIARTGGRLVLATGTATGHAHAISSKGAKLFALPGRADAGPSSRADNGGSVAPDRILVVTGRAVALEHEEHRSITLPTGTYRVRIQREYTPAAIVNVQD